MMSPVAQLDSSYVVADAIGDLCGNHRTAGSVAYLRNIKKLESPIVHTVSGRLNHNKRSHSAKVEIRFSLYQLFHRFDINPGIFSKVSQHLLDPQQSSYKKIMMELEKVEYPQNCLAGKLKTKSDLYKLIKRHKTKKHSQRMLDPKKPSPTVLSIPDDEVHPWEPRTLTVREEARLQSFPDRFEFKSKETTGGKLRKIEVPQYTQVGNAVPPLMARELGKLIKNLIK